MSFLNYLKSVADDLIVKLQPYVSKIGSNRGKYIDQDRKNHIQLIQRFCESDEQNGGVFLLSGPRGSGKSRLVDEALSPSTTSRLRGWYECLRSDFGANSRPRYAANCGPKKNRRLLVKVNVTPYFPHYDQQKKDNSNNSEKKDNSNSRDNDNTKWQQEFSEGHKNQLSLLLLRNVVFALTSTIDPRRRWRWHGRVLPQKIGWFRYLFSFTGFTVSYPKSLLSFSYLVLLFGFYLCFQKIGVLQNSQYGWWSFTTLWLLSWPIITLAVVIIVLRILDWIALARTSGRLYDLAHAQEVSNTNLDLAEKFDVSIHPRNLISTGGLLALLVGLLLSAFLFVDTIFKILELGNLASFFSTPSIEINLSLGIKLAPALLGIIIFGASVLLRRASRRYTALYGNRNPAWLVTLLRRYLYIAHRCGLEPVLVFDELDKLEEPTLTKNHVKESTQDDELIPKNREKYELSPAMAGFLEALLRLRDSSGAGFLLILIATPRLHYYLIHHRRQTLDKDITVPSTGTLVTQTLCLGPLSPDAAKEYFQQKGKASNLNNTQDANWQYLWIRARGSYANYRRLLEQYSLGLLRIPPDLAGDASEIFNIISKIWLLDAKIVTQLLRRPNSAAFSLQNQTWDLSFIQLGMLQQSYAEIEGMPSKDTVYNLAQQPDFQTSSLISSDPYTLTYIGRMFMSDALDKAQHKGSV